MAIDPDVQVKIDALAARVAVLEGLPAVGDNKIVLHSVTLEDGTVLNYPLET